MNAIFNKQLYLHLCLTLTIFTFTVNHAIGQELPFEIEDHFEIHEDVDLGIKLMPEGGCENSTSDEYGFVFKRRVIEINTGAPFPPEGECGQRFGDPFLEFYPSDFNSTGAVGSLLGTPEYPWGRLYTDRISLADNGGINGASSSFYGAFITLPAGTNFIAEGDNLIDDGVIYSPQVSNSDVVVASNDKIEMRFRRNTNQSDSHFAITETGSSNVRFKVGPGGTIFMPALPSTFSGYPVVVFNPADGQLYYQGQTDAVSTPDTSQDMQSQIQRLQEDNQVLRDHVNRILEKYELQAKEIENLKLTLKTNNTTN